MERKMEAGWRESEGEGVEESEEESGEEREMEMEAGWKGE